MQKDKQIITIKGTKEGLIFSIDDTCSFQDIVSELEKVLLTTPSEVDTDNIVSVILKFGYRFVTDEQKAIINSLIERDNRFIVHRYDSEVIGKKQAEELLDRSEVKAVTQIVRSGQVVEVTGDLLLIGDVNPGGQVKATGNIYILGNLRGIAHAGVDGNEEAVIAASYMNPSQLRIASFISRAPDYESDGVYMECGYLDKENNKIVIDRLQVLPYVRKKLRRLERGIENG